MRYDSASDACSRACTWSSSFRSIFGDRGLAGTIFRTPSILVPLPCDPSSKPGMSTQRLLNCSARHESEVSGLAFFPFISHQRACCCKAHDLLRSCPLSRATRYEAVVFLGYPDRRLLAPCSPRGDLLALRRVAGGRRSDSRRRAGLPPSGGAFRARADLCAKANGESLDKRVRRRRLRPGRPFRLWVQDCGPALLGGVR